MSRSIRYLTDSLERIDIGVSRVLMIPERAMNSFMVMVCELFEEDIGSLSLIALREIVRELSKGVMPL
jgi:hypothetical protein